MIKKLLKKIHDYFLKNKKKSIIGLLGLFFVVVIGILFFIKDRKPDFFDPRPEYAKIYSVVNEKISQSATIAINIPSGEIMSKEEAQEKVEFFPKIKGTWIDIAEEKMIAFRPEEKLKLNRYYTVTLETPEGIIGGDFLAVEDPEVLKVFPKENSEANEESSITVMFNRPMTPITTLDVLEDFDIPIEIKPDTKGKFKWIGTSTLQFIPEQRLTRSSNYNVRVRPEFISMDGLEVKTFEHNFTTRALRYGSITQGITIYNNPIAIEFNQNVNLVETIKQIALVENSSNQQVKFIAEYGSKNVYNKETEKKEKKENRSIILIYNQKDQFGREKLWDFNGSYNLKINKAYPEEGDIVLDELRETSIKVTDIIKSISASSERTSFSTPEYFDPEGKLWIEFYEEIDSVTSRIGAEKQNNISYGQKCKENNQNIEVEEKDCEKEDDRQKISISFNHGNINNSEMLKVSLSVIKNMEGFQLNSSEITKDVTVIPNLVIYRTIPGNGVSNASLSEFVICSNSPLNSMTSEVAKEKITSNDDLEFKHWSNSVLIQKNNTYYKCQIGEFETRINYRLKPETDYSLKINVLDNFGRGEDIEKYFQTGLMPEQYLNFLSLQKRYNVTTPEKTKLSYAVENMDFIDVNFCEIDPENLLQHLYHESYSYTRPTPATDCIKRIQKRIPLENKYWVKNYFDIDLQDYFEDETGHYLLTFSNPNYRNRYGKKEMIYQRTYVTVTNLGVVEKKIESKSTVYGGEKLSEEQKNDLQNIYWVTDLKELTPIENAGVRLVKEGLFAQGGKTYYTNSSGIAETNIDEDLIGALISKESDSAVISKSRNKFNYASTAQQARKIYVYTDRPIYKPCDDVNLKGLYRLGYDGDYEIFDEDNVLVKVFNSKNEEIFNEEIEVTDFGTFSARLLIDTKAPLGTYRIQVKDNSAYFDVEEYVPAAFKLETKTDQDEYISGDTLNMDVEASYYFGAPLEGGVVEYSIATQDYYFDKYQDEYFNFGYPWYYCYEDCEYGDKFIVRGKVELDDSGKAKISQKLDIKEFFDEDKQKSKIFIVYATVKNSNGQSVSTQKSFIVHQGEYYLGLKTNKYFFGKNESFEIKAKSVNTDGEEVSVNNIALKINKVNWVQNKRKEVDGGYYNNWKKEYELVQEKYIRTDQNGNYKESYSIKKEGEYEITVEGTDSKGNKIKGTYYAYVYGQAHVDIRRTNDDTLEVITNKNNLKVGDEAEIIIKSPYEKAKALISIERGRVFEYKVVDINQSLYRFKFNVSEEYLPNFFVSVILVSPDPEVKFGKLDFQVDTENKKIDIIAKTDKTVYLPGEEVVLNIEAKDFKNKPVEAELSVAVADLSVLALKGNPKKNPLVFFYGGFPLTVSTSSNVKNILYEVDVENETKGGGGAEAEDLAKKKRNETKGGGGAEAEDLAKKKRGEFLDTSFWQAVLKTDKEGKAQVKFTLPDNLTTWQIETVGISKDTKLGVGYQEFISRKNVMVVPLKPRFVVPGDEFFIGAKIFNQTNQRQNLAINYTSLTLNILNDNDLKNVSLEKGETRTVYFSVKANSMMQNGSHKFIISAKNNDYEDTVENTIKITRNDTYEATATSGYSSEEVVNEFVYLPDNISKDRGEMTIKNSATLAVFLSDGLNYLLSYPYGCSEQIASKLDAIAVVKKGLNIKNLEDKFEIKNIEFEGQEYTVDEAIEIGLARLYENQKGDGSFGYYSQSPSNVYLTLHIAMTLKNVKDAGYNINEESLRRSFNYINNRISYDTELQKNRDLMILAVYSLSELEDYGEIKDNLFTYIKSFEKDQTFLNEDVSNTSLATLAMLTTKKESIFGNKFKNEIFDILENRIDIDSRGAFLPAGKNVMWQYYGTPIKDTALLLKALVEDERENEILDKILRWILRSRYKDGAWGSTNNTITVLDSLTDYLIWKRETESNFTLKIVLDDVEEQSHSYNAETILNQNSFEKPVSEMKFGTLSKLQLQKENKNGLANNFYYDISLKYFLPIEKIPPRDEGFSITREFYALEDKKNEDALTQAKVGDVLRGHIKIFVPKYRNFVSVEDFIPAGVELINFDLATADRSLIAEEEGNNRYYYDWRLRYENERKFNPDMKEYRNDRLFLFKENLPEGEYEFDYYVRVLVPGKFHHLPAVVSEMYFPENFARTSGRYFQVAQ